MQQFRSQLPRFSSQTMASAHVFALHPPVPFAASNSSPPSLSPCTPLVPHPHLYPASIWSPTLPLTLNPPAPRSPLQLHLSITTGSPCAHRLLNLLFTLHLSITAPSPDPPHLPPALPFTLHLSVTAPSPFAYQSHALPSPCPLTWHDRDAACKVWGLEKLVRNLVRPLRSAAPDLRQGAA